jgi:hypothetical protein
LPNWSVPTASPRNFVISQTPQVAEFHQEKIILKNGMAKLGVGLADSRGL